MKNSNFVLGRMTRAEERQIRKGVYGSTGPLTLPKSLLCYYEINEYYQPDLFRLDTYPALKRFLVDISAWPPAYLNFKTRQSLASKHGMTPIAIHTRKSGYPLRSVTPEFGQLSTSCAIFHGRRNNLRFSDEMDRPLRLKGTRNTWIFRLASWHKCHQ